MVHFIQSDASYAFRHKLDSQFSFIHVIRPKSRNTWKGDMAQWKKNFRGWIFIRSGWKSLCQNNGNSDTTTGAQRRLELNLERQRRSGARKSSCQRDFIFDATFRIRYQQAGSGVGERR
jgi:hypothetical protein